MDGWRCVSGVLIGVVVVRPFLFRNGRGAPDEPALAILPAPQRSPPSLQTVFHKVLCSGSSTKLVAIAQSPGRGRADGREQFVEAKPSSKVVTGKHEIYMSVPKDALTGCVLPSSTYCWPTCSHQESELVSVANRNADSNHAAYLRISDRELKQLIVVNASRCYPYPHSTLVSYALERLSQTDSLEHCLFSRRPSLSQLSTPLRSH